MVTYEITEFTANIDVCRIDFGALTKVSAKHVREQQQQFGINKITESGLVIELNVYFTDYMSAFQYLTKI